MPQSLSRGPRALHLMRMEKSLLLSCLTAQLNLLRLRFPHLHVQKEFTQPKSDVRLHTWRQQAWPAALPARPSLIPAPLSQDVWRSLTLQEGSSRWKGLQRPSLAVHSPNGFHFCQFPALLHPQSLSTCWECDTLHFAKPISLLQDPSRLPSQFTSKTPQYDLQLLPKPIQSQITV